MIRHQDVRGARRRAGMTLMELVVALVIVAAMAAVGTAAFTSLVDHRNVVRRATVDAERAAALRDMIRSWIQDGSVQIQRGGGPNLARSAAPSAASTAGANAGVTSAAQGAGDELTVVTDGPNPAMQAGVRIRLYVDVDPNTPEKGLSIEYQTSTQTPLQRRMLDSAVDSLVVEFLDSRTNRWFESSQAATITPWALRVTMLPTQGHTIPRLLQLPIVLKLPGASNPASGVAAGGGG